MRGNALFFSFGMLGLAATAGSQSLPDSLPSDADIGKILSERIGAQHQSVGIVVGIIGPDRRGVISYGRLDKDDPRPITGDTIFEIGSATKVFTSLLLAYMVQREEAALDDPVAKYLPSAVKVPGEKGRSITLVDLAAHTSGLPRLPTNRSPN
jgi:serine-type D-Ala-D-Ala carboxypeptidase/endopeptidase